MIVSIDDYSLEILRRLKGSELVRMLGRRYPNLAAYDHVQLVTARGFIFTVEIRMEDVRDKLEVPCVVVRQMSTITVPDRCDDIRLADFKIDEVHVMRRAEWLDAIEAETPAQGDNPELQKVGNPTEAPVWKAHALVDAGLMLRDLRGSSVVFQADTFPLVIQCHYSVSSERLPFGDAREIDAC